MWLNDVKTSDSLPAAERDMANAALSTQIQNLESACLKQGISALNQTVHSFLKDPFDKQTCEISMDEWRTSLGNFNATIDVFFLQNNTVQGYQASSGIVARNVLTAAEQKLHLKEWTGLLDAVVTLACGAKQEALDKGEKISLKMSNDLPSAVSTAITYTGDIEDNVLLRNKLMDCSRPVLRCYGTVLDFYSDARGHQLLGLLKGGHGTILSAFFAWMKDKMIPSYTDAYVLQRNAVDSRVLKPDDHCKETMLIKLFTTPCEYEAARAECQSVMDKEVLSTDAKDTLKELAKCVASAKDYHELRIALDISDHSRNVVGGTMKLSSAAPSSTGIAHAEWVSLQGVSAEVTTNISDAVDAIKGLKRTHLASDNEAGAASIRNLELALTHIVTAYVTGVLMGIEIHVVRECEGRVPHAEWAAICSGQNLPRFGEAILASAEHNQASDFFWPAKTLDLDLDKLLMQWAPISIPKELTDSFDTIKARMGKQREYFASVLAIMKIATDLAGKSQGSKGSIKREFSFPHPDLLVCVQGIQYAAGHLSFPFDAHMCFLEFLHCNEDSRKRKSFEVGLFV